MVYILLKQISTPARITAASFFGLIAFVTILLALPFSHAAGRSVGFVDAFFLATSAVCVTGLSPIDITKELSGIGQLLILVSMQIGGLGLMTFTTVFYAAFGKRLPIVNNLIIQQTFHHKQTPHVKQLLFYVVGFTFFMEFIGAMFYFIYWTLTGRFATPFETLKHSVFMSVSAFTNGGFTLFSDSLVGFQEDYLVLLVTAGLILFGGIGFLVNFELKSYFEKRLREPNSKKTASLSVQTKLTLLATAVIIVLGTAGFFFYERYGAFAHLSSGEALLNAFFFTLTPRTAGFNSINMLSLHASSIFLLIVFMLIGAGAGSTGGGIKIGTVGLVTAYMFAKLRGKERLSLWHRTIPKSSVDKAIAVASIFGLLAVFTTLALMYTETHSMGSFESRLLFQPIVFEAVSALCTVGISLDFTPQLTEIGKIVVTIAMFVGRLSPIGLAVAITSRAKKDSFKYAEENMIIG